MIEFIKGIANRIVSLFTAGVMTVADVILPSPTPIPMPIPISTSTLEISTQNATTTNLPTINQTPTPIIFLTARGKFSYREKNVDIELSMPENGGKLTGSAKGLCNGTIEGIYQKDNNTITGTANGACVPQSVGLSHPDYDDSSYFRSSGEFSGEVNSAEKVIRVKFKGRVYPPYFSNGGHINVGEMNLVLSIQ